MLIPVYLCIAVALLSMRSANAYTSSCSYPTVSPPIQGILCAVESGKWNISNALSNPLWGKCLLGGRDRCNGLMHIPTEKDVPASPPSPVTKNPDYTKLALISETLVPKSWWKAGFAHPLLDLSKNSSDLPVPHLNLWSKSGSNLKLRDMYKCMTERPYLRISVDFKDKSPKKKAERYCPAMKTPVVKNFQKVWNQHKSTLGGKIVDGVWFPEGATDHVLLTSANDVLDYFYQVRNNTCSQFRNSADCRGAIAAASLVASAHIVDEAFGKREKAFSESKVVRGYILASLGRVQLHVDSSAYADVPTTSWGVRLTDFIALQQVYLRLYSDSFGAAYSAQLKKHIPMPFAPKFQVVTKERFRHLSHWQEPVYTSMRNWMHHEAGVLIDMGPYVPLVAIPEVREYLQKSKHKRVLIDVGANGFFASPKYLLDSYAVHMPFTHAVMIEPEPHFTIGVPKVYTKRYKIQHLPIYAEVGSNTKTDILKLLPTMVSKDDFVVLKFDVDVSGNPYGPTMEWGFLYSIMSNPEVAGLIDELYIELHFTFPFIGWRYEHSNWEALDTFRYLRENGVIVHAWP